MEKFCQSCGMPLTEEIRGTEQDGSKNALYCFYCYQNGDFTSDVTLDEMIEECVPHMAAAHPEMSEEEARKQMKAFFPTLIRWRPADRSTGNKQ